MNKKGDISAEKVIFYILFGFVFVGACIILLYIISEESSDIIQIPKGLGNFVFVQMFLNNPECFAYQDLEIGRIYPGIIDLEKFTSERFDSCYKGDIQFRLKIKDKIVETSDFKMKKGYEKQILIFKDNKFEEGKIYIEE